jgi:hypothetical protein
LWSRRSKHVLPETRVLRLAARFDAPGFAYDAAEDSGDRALVEGPSVVAAGARKHVTFAPRVVERQPRVPLERAYLSGETRAPVQQAKQFSINLVNLRSPVFYTHLLGLLGPRRPKLKQKEPATISFREVVAGCG